MQRPSLLFRLWLPSVGVIVWLIVFIGLQVTSQRTSMISADGDPCWHWRLGQWMIEHGTILRIDEFSHTCAGKAVVTKEWLGEIIFAAAGGLFGWNGIMFICAALIATCLWLVHRQLVSETSDVLLSTLLVLVLALVCQVHWVARPLLFTHLLLAYFSWRLWAFGEGRISVLGLFVQLVPLTVLWTNLHGGFIFGIILVATFAMGNGIEWLVSSESEASVKHHRLTVLSLLTLTCMAASLVNPNGWHLHEHILKLSGSPIVAFGTDEMQFTNFHHPGMRGFVLQLFFMALLLAVARPRFRATEIVLFVVWGYWALQGMRNVPLFGIIVTPILARHGSAFLGKDFASTALAGYRRLSASLTAVSCSAGGVAFVIVAIGAMCFALAKPLVHTRLDADRFPVDAVRFLRSHPDAVRGRMFNEDSWGGYLMLEWPEQKVFIDGRYDLYGEQLVKDYLRVVTLHPKWEEVSKKYEIGWVIVPARSMLATYLALRSDWKRAYNDGVAVIYTRI